MKDLKDFTMLFGFASTNHTKALVILKYVYRYTHTHTSTCQRSLNGIWV